MKTAPQKTHGQQLARTLLAFSALLALCVLAPHRASAQLTTYDYDPNAYTSGIDSWSTGTPGVNWDNGGPVSSQNTVLNFYPVSGGGVFTNSGALNDFNDNDFVTQPFLLNTLNLSGTGSANASSPVTVTIEGGTLNFVDSSTPSGPVLNLTAANGTSTVTYNLDSNILLGDNLLIQGSGNAAFNIGGSISDGGLGYGLDMTASGTLVLSGANTYIGVTTLAAGVLNLDNASAISTGTITFTGGELQYSTLNQGDYSSQIIGSTSAIALDLNGQTVTYASVLGSSNTGGLTVQTSAPGGTLILTAANAYSGATIINQGATLQLGNGSSGSDGTISFTSGVTNSGTLVYDRFGSVSSSYAISGTGNVNIIGTGTQILIGANTYSGSTVIGAGATLQLGNGTTGNDGTIGSTSGVLDSGALVFDRFATATAGYGISGAGTVSVIGTGTQIFTAANTYSGSTNIGAGATLQLGNGTTGHDGNIASSLNIGNAGTLVFDRFGSSTYGGAISGNGALTVIGTGTEILTGANIYTGLTTLGGGVLNVGSATALAGGGSITFSGGILQYSTSNQADYSPYIASSASAIAIDVNGQTVTFASALNSNNTGGLTVLDTTSGTLILTAANNYSGATTISHGATLQLGNGSSGSDGTISFTSGVTDSGTLTYDRFGSASSSYVISGTGNVHIIGLGTQTLIGANTYSGSTVIGAGATLQLGNGTNGNDGTIGSTSGVLDSGALVFDRFATATAGYGISGAGTVSVIGTGTQIFTATNTYSGSTNIGSGATMQLGSGGIAGSINSSLNIGDAGTLVLDLSGANNTYSGTISGVGALSVIGTGTQTLTGSNTYSGATTLSAGMLSLGSANALNGGGSVTFKGGVLQYSSSYTTDLSSQIVSSGSAIKIDVNGQNIVFGSSLNVNNTGGLTLFATGGGSLALNGANAYTGTTTLAAGTLKLGNASALPTGVANSIVFLGGTLQYSASNQGDYSGQIAASTGAIAVDVNGQTVTYASALANTNTAGLTLLDSTSGTLILTAANLYTGATTISQGATLQMGNGTTGMDGTIVNTSNIADSGTLTYDRFASSTYSGTISGTGNVNVIGVGTQILSGTNSYSGSTKIGTGATLQLGAGGLAGSIDNSLNIGDAGTLTLDISGTSNTYTGNISGVGALTVLGTGTNILSGNNTFSGTTTLGGGILNIGSATAFGGGGKITFSGGTFQYSSSFTTDLSSSIVSSGSAITVDVNNQAITFASALNANNTGGLTVLSSTPGGSLTLSAAEAYTGTTTVSSGTLILASGGSLSTSSVLQTTGTGVFELGNATAAVNVTVGGIAGTSGTIVGGYTTPSTLTINNTSATGTYGGVFGASGGNSNDLALVIKGGGLLNLGGVNTYTGGMTIESGTVAVTAANHLSPTVGGSNSVTLGDASTLAQNAAINSTANVSNSIATTAAALSGSLAINITGAFALSGSIQVNNSLYVNETTASALALSGTYNLVSGTSNLIVTDTGAGITNTATLIGSGTIIFNANGQTVTMNSPGSGNNGDLNFYGGIEIASGTLTASSQAYNDQMTLIVNSGANFGTSAGSGNSNNPFAGLQNGPNGGGSIVLNRQLMLGGNGSYTFGGSITTFNSGVTLYHYGVGTQTLTGSVNTVVATSGAGMTISLKSGTMVLSNPAPLSTGTTGASSLTFNNTFTVGNGGNTFTTGTLLNSPNTVVSTGSNATLKIVGNYVIDGSSSGNIQVLGGNGTTTGQGTLSLQDSQINTLTLNNVGAAATQTLTFAAGTILAMDVGNNAADQIVTTGNLVKINVPNTAVTLNLNGLGNITSSGSAALILDAGGDGALSTTGFTLGTATGNFDGVTSLSLTQTSGTLELVWGAPTTPASGNIYWTGTQSSGSWNAFSGGLTNNSNWSTTSNGLTDPHGVPASANDVYFSASNAIGNFNTTLGQNISIQGLYFTNVGSAVTINGGTNTLTIGTDGLTVQSGAPTPTLNTNIATSANQTWSINNGGVVSLNGTLSGANNITVASTGGSPGTLLLSGTNTYSGLLTINNNAIVELSAGNTGALNGDPGVTFGASSSGTLELNGNNATISNLSSNATATSAIIENNNLSTASMLTGTQTANTTFYGTLQNGGGGMALGFTMNGPDALTLAGNNTYSGSTIVNGGLLAISGTVGGSGVAVNSTGTLGGSGKITSAVTVNHGGELMPGTAATPVTLTLTSGLTITGTSGGAAGILAFNINNTSSYDQINITGGAFTLNNGALIEVTTGVTASGTYALVSFTGAAPSLTNVSVMSLADIALPSSYSFTDTLNTGTLDLIITPTNQAIPGITFSSPAANLRVMEGVSLGVTGNITNSGTANALSGTLSGAGGSLTVGSLTGSPIAVAANNGTAPFAGTIASTGATPGLQTYEVTVADGSASPQTASVTGTVDVLQNRVLTTTVGTVALGLVHAGATFSGTTGLQSTGADTLNTRVTIINTSGTAATDVNGVSVVLSNPSGVFNGSLSETGTVTGAISTAGTYNNGTIILSTTTAETGGPLTGETDGTVTVNYTATVFSGHATWASNIGSSWGTNGNWGDTASSDINGIGAPGLAGAASNGDTALFGDVSGEALATTVSLNGANPSLAGMTFNSTSTSYTIAAGTGGTITLQNGATITVTTGTATLAANFTGSGGLTINGPGELVTSGSNDLFNGSGTIASGTFIVTNVGAGSGLGTGGSGTYSISSGAAMELENTTNQEFTMGNSFTVTGSGSLIIAGSGSFQFHSSSATTGLILDGTGGVIEIASGTVDNGGAGGGNGFVWTNNKDSLQIDSAATFDVWDTGNALQIDALTGSGTMNRFGYNITGFTVTVGDNNGSGTFAGAITQQLGSVAITKTGSGLEVFTGSNSYTGETTINSGTLRITTSAGLGQNGLTFVAAPTTSGTQFNTLVTGAGSTLDLNSGTSVVDLNNKVTLSNGGSLINSAAGTTSILDSGVVGVSFTADPQAAGTYTVTITGGNGLATATAATVNGNAAPLDGGNANNLSVQLTAAGSGYTPGTTTATISNGVGNVGGTVTAVVSSLNLSGTGNSVGGNGNLTINAQILGSGGFSTIGTGILTLNNANTYTGTTTINNDTVILGNALGLGSTANGLAFGAGATGTLELDGFNVTVGSLTTNSGTVGTPTVENANATPVLLTINQSGSTTFGGAFADGAGGGNLSVTLAGAGKLVLTGTSTNTGAFTINTGTLQLGNGTTGNDGSVSSNIVDSTSLIFDRFGTSSYGGNITGSGTLTMLGTGTQTLTGNNSYSGSTILSGGVLNVGSATALPSGGPITFKGGTLQYSAANGAVDYSPYIVSSGSAVSVDVNGQSVTYGTALASTNSGGITVYDSAGGGRLILTAAEAYTGTTTVTGGATLQFGNNTSGSDGTTSTNIVSNGVTVYDYAGSQTYTGTISGTGGVTVEGSGTLVAVTTYTYDGTTSVNTGATLQLGNGTTGHDGQLNGGSNLVNNGVTTYDYVGSHTYSGNISGTGNLLVEGSGTLGLSGSNSYSGNTFVYDGDLIASNTLGSASGSGTLNVAPNASAPAVLSGNGIIGGPVITASASGLNVPHIAPGVNTSGNFGVAGTLTLGNGLTIGNGTNLDFDLGTSSDLVAVTGQLTLGTGVVLNVNQLAGFGVGTYELISYSGALTGNASSWTATGIPGTDNATFSTATANEVTVTIALNNNSTLAITPSPISLGAVLQGYTPASVTGTLTNNGSVGSGTYATASSGSATISPANGTLAPSATQALTVGASAPLTQASGNNVVIGTVSATNSANPSGSAAPVNVTANIYQVASLTTGTISSGSSATLDLTNAASSDGGQRAGVTVYGYSTTNSNFDVTTDNGGVVGTANGSAVTQDVGTVTVAPDLLSGTYSYVGTITGSAEYTNPTLQGQGGGSLSNPQWTGVTISGTVSASAPYGQTNSAAVGSSSSIAGYGLTSSSGSMTTATILNGTSSANINLTMQFSSHGTFSAGEQSSASPFQSSDTLTIGGLNPIGGSGPDGGSTLTDTFVLQLNVATNANVVGNAYFLGWWDPNFGASGGWVNAIAGNSNAVLPADYGLTGAYFAGTYAEYLTANSYTTATPLSDELGAYGYDSTTGVAWAVVDYDSDVEVIPEPATYAMIFSGFGMLVGFRKLRRRRRGSE